MSTESTSSSVILLEDSETEEEETDVNSNDTNEVICHDNTSIYKSRNIKRSSLDDIDVTTMPMTSSFVAENRESSRFDDSIMQPAFKVIFRDESLSKEYRKQIKDFLNNLIQSEVSSNEDADASSLILEIWDNKNNTKNIFSSLNTKSNDTLNSISTDDHILLSNDNNKYNSLFTIDIQPNTDKQSNINLDIPVYHNQKYENTFEESNSEVSRDPIPKLSCFNCNGNHNLRDCQLPRNQANINKNRKEFAAKNNTGVRYHLSEDQKFHHMIPGKLSSKLRQALGLKDNQLPIHIYRMRLLGYPPGWLEEARLQHSGLSLFNSDGLAEADPNDEEGEIIADKDRDQYDFKKIYDFPGFNVPPPPGIIDDSHKYWVPQMQPIHSKETMLFQLQGKKAENGYKRKKLKLSVPVNSKTFSDMEIEDTEDIIVENVLINDHFVPPLPKELVPTSSILSSSELSESIVEDSDSRSRELPSLNFMDDVTTNSPSLSDLESRKKKLLIELEDVEGSNSHCTSYKSDLNIMSKSNASLSCITSQSDCSPTLHKSLNQNSGKLNMQHSSNPSSNLNSTITSDMSLLDTSITFSPNSNLTFSTPQSSSSTNRCVKSVHLGTPILQSSSPYNKLPSSEKFSQNICNVINFENLPNTTGKYEQMSGVLRKIRKTMAKLHQ